MDKAAANMECDTPEDDEVLVNLRGFSGHDPADDPAEEIVPDDEDASLLPSFVFF